MEPQSIASPNRKNPPAIFRLWCEFSEGESARARIEAGINKFRLSNLPIHASVYNFVCIYYYIVDIYCGKPKAIPNIVETNS